MSDHTYKLVEIVGSSAEGTDAAIRNAIDTASKSIRHIDWFEVVETRGHVVDGKVGHFQVTLKIGFRLESEGKRLRPGSPAAGVASVAWVMAAARLPACVALTPALRR